MKSLRWALLLLFALGLRSYAQTLTANTEVMHVGDPVPPLTYHVSTASWSGAPVLSTTATSSSAVGDYTITITAGTVPGSPTLVNGVMHVIAADGIGAKLTMSVTHPSGFMYDVTAHGVDNTCATDAGAAIQTILSSRGNGYTGEQYDTPLFLYFPAGCYKICATTLTQNGDTTTYEGAGPGQTIWKVPADCPAFNGSSFIPVLGLPSTGDNTQNFRNYMYGITIDIGPRNPKAYALDWLGNNSAGIENVQLISEDSSAAIMMKTDRYYDGPSLKKNIAIYGGQTCWRHDIGQYTSAEENITLQGCQTVGIDDTYLAFSIRHLLTCMTPSAISLNAAITGMLDSELLCGGSGNSAVNNPNGAIWMRDVSVGGYGHSISEGATPTHTDGNITEHWTGAAQHLFDAGTAGSLRLPILETPVAVDPAPSTWIKLSSTDVTQWATQLATCASTTAYVAVAENNGVIDQPSSTPIVTNVNVPDCINHIIGYDVYFKSTGTPYSLGSHVKFIVNGSSTTPVVIERFSVSFDLDHNGSRVVALRHSLFPNYTPGPNARDVFFEDTQLTPTTFLSNQRVWARQLDIEANLDKLTCDGAKVWVLSYKTEVDHPSVVAKNGCQAEILGSFLFPLYEADPTDSLMTITNSQLFTYFYEGGQSYANGSMDIAITETQAGVTRTLPTGAGTSGAGFGLPMYYAKTSSSPPVIIPAKRANLKKNLKVN